MTWNAQPNLEDVRYGSGLLGHSYNYINKIPNGVVVNSSGGASKTSGEKGLQISAGTTSGDGIVARTAMLSTQNFDSGNFDKRFVATFALDDPTPWTDIGKVGLQWREPEDNTSGAYIDLKNEQANVDGTTASLSSLPSGEMIVLEILGQKDGNKTIFNINANGNRQSGTVNRNVSTYGGVASIQSNGGGESLNLLYTTYQMEGY